MPLQNTPRNRSTPPPLTAPAEDGSPLPLPLPRYSPLLPPRPVPWPRVILPSPLSSALKPMMTGIIIRPRSEEHTSELQSLTNLVCRLLLEKKNTHHTQ